MTSNCFMRPSCQMKEGTNIHAKIYNPNYGNSYRRTNYQTATDGQVHLVHHYQQTRPSTHSQPHSLQTFVFRVCLFLHIPLLCLLFLVYNALVSQRVRGHPHLIACRSVLESQLLRHVIFHYAFDSSPGSWGSV